MAILKCLTHMLEMFIVKVMFEDRVVSDISSTDNLVHCFQSLYGATDLYELKGLQITKYDLAISSNVSRKVLKRSSGQHVLQRPLFCSSSSKLQRTK